MMLMPSVAIAAVGKNNRKAPSDQGSYYSCLAYDLRDGKETIL
mgnify:CR=1